MDFVNYQANVENRKSYGSMTVLVLYGAPNETHEASFVGQTRPVILEGSGVTLRGDDIGYYANWAVTPQRKVLRFTAGSSSLFVYLLGMFATGIRGFVGERGFG